MPSSSLATIMFTDLVDSTGQRSRLGDDAADAIVGAHDNLVAEAAADHGGRVVKTLGDGALLAFASAIDAVGAGIDILAAAGGQNISVRVGIHAGEVVTVDGDVSGLPVAVASRVCAVAEGGTIVVTGVVKSLIGRRGDIGLTSIGPHALKGVSEPMDLWLVADEAAAPVPVAEGDLPLPGFLARAVPSRLVGRDADVERLEAAMAGAGAGVARLVAVIGEPGIGKTALTSTWASDMAVRGATVVGGRCTSEVSVPYQPFIDVARTVLSSRPGRFPRLGPAAGNIAMLVPGVDAPHHLPAPVQSDPDTMRYLMAEAFLALCEPVDEGSATVVVLDDLHWADEASLEVLAHMVRSDDRFPMLVVGTYRDTDILRGHPLSALLADLRREGRVERIRLDPLDTDEVGELVSARIGHDIAADLAHSIGAETRGNPFFVAEMTAHLRDEGAIDAKGKWVADVPIEQYGIPEGIRDVVGRRLDRLGPDANALLAVGAVVGPLFALTIAGDIAGLDDDRLDDALEAAMEAGLIVEGDTADQVSFGHALVRQTIYDEMPTRRRLRLHRSVAEALEETGAPAAEVLRHFVTANVPDRALGAAVRAGHEAQAATAHRDAVRYFETTLDLWDEVPDPVAAAGMSHARVVLELSRTLGDFAVDHGRGVEMIDAELARDEPDDAERALLYIRKSDHLWQSGDLAGSDASVTSALEIVPREPPSADLALVLANQAGRQMTAGHHEAAIEVGMQAAAVLARVDAPIAEIRVTNTLGTAYGSLGDVEESDVWFDRLRDLARSTGNVRARLVGFMNQGEVYRLNGRFEDSLDLFEEGRSAAAQLGAQRWAAALTANLADVLYLVGRWDEAIEYLDAIPPAAELDFPELAMLGRRMQIAAERGDESVFAAAEERLAGYDLTNQEPQVNAAIWGALMAVSRWRGELPAAYELARTAMGAWSDVRIWMESAQAAAIGVGIIADGVEFGVAEEPWLDDAVSWNDHLQASTAPGPYVDVWKRISVAELARARGADDPELWTAALAVSGDRPYTAATIQWARARALLRHDPADPEVPPLLDTVATTADDLGATPLQAAIEQLI